MISAGIEGRLPYMTYSEPWGSPPKQPPEFLRPAPKPLPQTRYYSWSGGASSGLMPDLFRRYNGVTISTSLNGTRLGPPQRPPSKYASPPAATPVNLTQPKDEVAEELSYPAYSPRLFPPPPPFTYHPSGPYATLYQSPYTPLIRSSYAPPPLSPLESPYTPTTPSGSNTATFLSPSATFSPPAPIQQQPPQTTVRVERKPSPSFKVPSGKEGSLKHRILTRPGDSVAHSRPPLDLQKATDGPRLSESTRKRLSAAVSPPRSPAKGSNSIVPASNFTKGSLIQLANGELRRVEDMRTEDFVNSAERSSDLRLADSTVVRIEENPILGTGTITLSYNQRRTQVEFEAPLEHPFFVYGQGWASCAPDRTLQTYGLKVHRLQVGDILISLTPREPSAPATSVRGSTIITTATTTAVTARQLSVSGGQHLPPEQRAPRPYHPPTKHHANPAAGSQHHAAAGQQQPGSPDCAGSKKRRWSAPDQICDEDEQNVRRIKT